MVLFEQFLMEGNEAADWLAKEEADLDGGVNGLHSKAIALRQEGWKYMQLSNMPLLFDDQLKIATIMVSN